MGANDLSLGGLFIGVILNVLFFGFSCVQIYLYQSRFKQDNWKIKALAYTMFLADFCNSLFDVIFLYRLLVTHFGDAEAANTADIFFALDPVMTGLIAFMCQSFFAWRVRRLTHTWWIPAIVILSGGASFLSAIGTTIGVTIVVYYNSLQRIRSVVIIWLTGAALADTVITTALIWTLNKSRTGFAATDDVLTRLIRATLQTGLLTSTFAIVDLILYLSSTSTLHLVFNLPLAKLYCNTLLSSLNARAMVPVTEHFTSEMQSTSQRQSNFRPTMSAGRDEAVDLETESRREAESKSSLPFRADSNPSLGYQEMRNERDLEKSEVESSPGSFQQRRGVHVLTVEEEYEEGAFGARKKQAEAQRQMQQQYQQQQQQQPHYQPQ